MTADRGRLVREYGITAGTLGSTAAQTTMVVLLPVLLAPHAPSAFWIGLAMASEGVFAIAVPYWIGALSDALPHRLARRFGRRTGFLVVTAPIMVLALVASPFLDGYGRLVALALVFFAAFHAYLTPLWALMVDAVPPGRRGRVHGVRGGLHSAGLAYGLVAGGLLFALWEPLPFLTAGALILATTAMTVAAAPREDRKRRPAADDGGERRVWRTLLHRRDIRWFLAANALWTGAVDGIRPFIFLFAVAVLGIDTAETSLVLLLLVGGLGIGAVLVGRLGDRYGRGRTLTAGALLTGVAMSLGVLVRELDGAVLLLSAAGLGAASLIALPYPIFTTLVGGGAIGRFTGLYVLSLGLARIAAPILVGAAIDVGARFFPAYQGYPLMWPMAGAMALLSVGALQIALAARRASIARSGRAA